MLTILSIIALGFFLGMRHATDPDHVIAITTIVSRYRSIRHAAVIGGLWGVGHTITILLVGSGIILFGLAIPARLGLTMELSVGVMLILLGVLNLSGVMRWLTESFTPTHSAKHGSKSFQSGHTHEYRSSMPPDSHSHVEDTARLSWIDRIFGKLGVYQLLRPLAVGIVHGLAGSAAVALFVLATIRVPYLAVAYLLVFGVGTIAGMMLITGAIAVPFIVSASRFARLNRGLSLASGMISVAFGLFVVYETGFARGLFAGNPSWTPQ